MRSQGQFGANYSVNGHRTSGERRVDFNKGYSFLFERCFEENTLEEIEKIDWSHVTVKTLDANYPPAVFLKDIPSLSKIFSTSSATTALR